jgi:hypothetical protein
MMDTLRCESSRTNLKWNSGSRRGKAFNRKGRKEKPQRAPRKAEPQTILEKDFLCELSDSFANFAVKSFSL